MVKLLSEGWQVPQVRPLPPNFSLKKIWKPWATSASVESKGVAAATRGPNSEASIGVWLGSSAGFACALVYSRWKRSGEP